MVSDAAVSGNVFPAYDWNVACFEGELESVLVALDWNACLPVARCQLIEATQPLEVQVSGVYVL